MLSPGRKSWAGEGKARVPQGRHTLLYRCGKRECLSRFSTIRYKDYPNFSPLAPFLLAYLGFSAHTISSPTPGKKESLRPMPVLLGDPEQPQIDISALEARSPRNQRRRMLLALCLLLTALILVLVRYRDFWLTRAPYSDADVSPATQQQTTTKSHGKSAKAHSAATVARSKHSSNGTGVTVAEAGTSAEVTRIVLNPLQVEVLRSNGRRQTIRTRPAGINI